VQSFENKTAVVTGGASGMGFAMASVFAREGMNLVLADVEKGALREAVAKIEAMGVEAIGVPTDVSSESEMDHLGEVVRERFGTPDVLCLNAGVAGGGGPSHLLTTKDWKWALDVNLYGVIHGLRAFLGGMRERNSGHIVMTASVAGLTSFPGSLPYNATKHAVVGVAETLFSELRDAESGVGVHCLCPGLVSTNIVHSERNRPKELQNPGKGATGMDPGVQKMVEGVFASAKPPAEVAELVFAAIVENRFWIQTDEFFRDSIKARHRAIGRDRSERPSSRDVQRKFESNSRKLDETWSKGPPSLATMSKSTYDGNRGLLERGLVWLGAGISSPPFSLAGRIEAGYRLRLLQRGERIGMPNSRPMPSIGPRCHALRVRDADHSWRLVYRIDPDAIVIV
jgi:NAD(P)-dependent dehydrogenase (short-subunit alcohol dehydrogenase family)